MALRDHPLTGWPSGRLRVGVLDGGFEFMGIGWTPPSSFFRRLRIRTRGGGSQAAGPDPAGPFRPRKAKMLDLAEDAANGVGVHSRRQVATYRTYALDKVGHAASIDFRSRRGPRPYRSLERQSTSISD